MNEIAKPRFVGNLRSMLSLDDSYLAKLWMILVGLLVFFLIVRFDSFLSTYTWISMGVAFPEFGIMALGVMLAMVTGGIDLSVVGIANMTSILAAIVMVKLAANGGSAPLAMLVAIGLSLLLGLFAGLLNGVLVAKLRIPAILVTLGTLEFFTGIAIVLSDGKPIGGLPIDYSQIVSGRVLGVVPVPLLIFAVVAIFVGIIFTKTTYGTQLYMLGTNATASKFSGLDLDRLLIKTYVISGLCGSVAGLIMLANYNSAKADYGASYTLLTVLIVVLGGVNPNGGSGKLSGVILAILILQILSSGLNMFSGISNFYRPLIWGTVLLLVISTTNIEWRWRQWLSKKRKED